MESEQVAEKQPVPSASGAPDKPPSRVPRPLFYMALALAGALALLVLGLYVWRALTVRELEQQLEEQKQELTVERQAALSEQALAMLRLTARPLVWSVRTEMLKDNLEQVDDYFREYVREPGVTSILLVGGDGTILVATNRKQEGQSAEGVVSRAMLDATDVVVDGSSGLLRLAAPVMSFSERLGVLVLDYQPQDAVANVP